MTNKTLESGHHLANTQGEGAELMQLPVIESAGQRVMLLLFAVSVLSVQAQLYIAFFFPLTLQQTAYLPRSYYMTEKKRWCQKKNRIRVTSFLFGSDEIEEMSLEDCLKERGRK